MESNNFVQAEDSTAKDSSPTFYHFIVAMEVKCPYSSKCIDFEKRCGSCKHNENRSFYEPDYPYRDYHSWYPDYPYYPYQDCYSWL